MVLLVYLLILLTTANSSSGSNVSSRNNSAMVWLCLEFCDETPEQIRNHLLTIQQHRDVVRAVSFEKYTLGANSTLIDNDLTEVSFQLNEIGVETWPLLSSFPHPDEFIDWMRQVFENCYLARQSDAFWIGQTRLSDRALFALSSLLVHRRCGPSIP